MHKRGGIVLNYTTRIGFSIKDVICFIQAFSILIVERLFIIEKFIYIEDTFDWQCGA